MTPDERTVVLEAIISYTHDLGAGETILCPHSWWEEAEKAVGDGVTRGVTRISRAWNTYTHEEKFLMWVMAPDSDYEFLEAHTIVVTENQEARAKLAAIREAKGTP